MWRFLYHLGLCALLGLPSAAWADDGGETPESPAAEQQTEADVVKAAVQPTKPVSSPETTEAAKAPEPSVVAAQSVPIERVTVSASATFRMLAVSDPDPANDRSMLYGLSARVGLPLDGLTTSVMTSLTTRFVAEEGDSAVRLGDSAMNVGYRHQHLAKSLTVAHRIGAWLPTSRSSLQRELRVAPTVRSSVNYAVIGPLSVGYTLQGQYRWYRYAEVPNRLAMNTQWVIGNGLNAGVSILDSPTFGKLDFSLSSGVRWMRKYPSLDQHESETADAALWNQMFTWAASLSYAPIKWVAVNIGADHGTSFRRNGIINPFIAHRDATELTFGVTARY